MVKTIEIPDDLYEQLKKHAIPFVDLSPVAVIQRWASDAEARGTTVVPQVFESIAPPVQNPENFNPEQPPNLFHTRCRGTFGTSAFSNWNDLVRIAHIKAFAKAGSFDQLRNVTHSQIWNGLKSDSGFHPLPQIGISVQGMDANHAWVHALRLAQYLNVPLRATIEWRLNPKAAFPGEVGTLEWRPLEM